MVCPHSLHIMVIHGHIMPATMILGFGTGDRHGHTLGSGDPLGVGVGVLLGLGDHPGIGVGVLPGVGDRHGHHHGDGDAIHIMQTIVRVVVYLTDPDPIGLQTHVLGAILVIDLSDVQEVQGCHNMEIAIPTMVSMVEARQTIIAPIVEMLLPTPGIV